jgi:CDP-paratose 2-epimerase
MRILITGICGFAGSTIARALRLYREGLTITGIDNFSRAGSRGNFETLRDEGFEVHEGDVRHPEDLGKCGACDWLIDAAANPSVLAGVDGKTGPAELLDHNLTGTIPMLEYCRRHGIPFTLLSTSRVYSIPGLRALPMVTRDDGFAPAAGKAVPGLSQEGVDETFSTEPPVSLYGASKRCAELLALEYAEAFGFPVWINRCGVLAGAGQFGKPDQGIFSYWIHGWLAGHPLRYLGFGGHGYQTRDCLHPADLVPLLLAQFDHGDASGKPRLVNVSGGIESACSLARLSAWCCARLGKRDVVQDGTERAYDLPWVVLDSALARAAWDWKPVRRSEDIFAEIADFARAQPGWLRISGVL